jgi:hypothetical protein
VLTVLRVNTINNNISMTSGKEPNLLKAYEFKLPINDEAKEGFLILMPSVTHLLEDSQIFTNPRGNYIFLTLLSDGVFGVIESILKEIWEQFEIAVMFLVISNSSQVTTQLST